MLDKGQEFIHSLTSWQSLCSERYSYHCECTRNRAWPFCFLCFVLNDASCVRELVKDIPNACYWAFCLCWYSFTVRSYFYMFIKRFKRADTACSVCWRFLFYFSPSTSLRVIKHSKIACIIYKLHLKMAYTFLLIRTACHAMKQAWHRMKTNWIRWKANFR